MVCRTVLPSRGPVRVSRWASRSTLSRDTSPAGCSSGSSGHRGLARVRRVAQALPQDLDRGGDLPPGLVAHAPQSQQPPHAARVSRSSTVSTLARSRALVARVPSPSSWMDESNVPLLAAVAAVPPSSVSVAASAASRAAKLSRQSRSISSALSYRSRGVPPQGLAEERHQRLAECRVEQLLVDGRLALDLRRLAAAVAPLRQRAGGQLEEGHGGGVSLGVQVPPLPQGQHRVEVALGAGLDVLGRRAGQREVEQDQVQLVAPADRPDADVVGLDVAVRDALLLQVLDDLQQVLAEPLEQIDVQPALLAQPLAQRLWPGRPQQQARLAADLERLDSTRRCAGAAACPAPRPRPGPAGRTRRRWAP